MSGATAQAPRWWAMRPMRKKRFFEWAIMNGKEEEVASLLDAADDLLYRDLEGYSPLMLAAEEGHVGVVRLLVQRGAIVSALSEMDHTALHVAAGRGRHAVVAFLLSVGAQANTRDTSGMTPLMAACRHDIKGCLDTVKLLFKHVGAQALEDRDDERRTALHFASKHRQESTVAFLLSKGADATVKDRRGRTPLMRAASCGHLAVLRLLFQHTGGEGLEERDEEGRTAMHHAASAYTGHAEVTTFLLDRGADASVRDREGMTPLMRAASCGRLAVVRLLFQHMGREGLDHRDEQGQTIMHHAAYIRHPGLVAFLLSEGADATVRDRHGMTPLMVAATGAHLDVMPLLLQHTGTGGLHAQDGRGETALHHALAYRIPSHYRDDAVRFLLLQGADPTIRDNEGRTPREVAETAERARGLEDCIVAFEWWDGELERRAVLSRASCLHKSSDTPRHLPPSKIPPCLAARVAAGHAVPVVEVVSVPPQEEQSGQTVGRGRRRLRAAGESEEKKGPVATEEERHAVVEYVVQGLNEQLFTEMLEGFH